MKLAMAYYLLWSLTMTRNDIERLLAILAGSPDKETFDWVLNKLDEALNSKEQGEPCEIH